MNTTSQSTLMLPSQRVYNFLELFILIVFYTLCMSLETRVLRGIHRGTRRTLESMIEVFVGHGA